MQNLTEDEEIALALAMSAEAAQGSSREPHEQPDPSVTHQSQPAEGVPVAQSTDSAAVEAPLPSKVRSPCCRAGVLDQEMPGHGHACDGVSDVCPKVQVCWEVLVKVASNLPDVCTANHNSPWQHSCTAIMSATGTDQFQQTWSGVGLAAQNHLLG